MKLIRSAYWIGAVFDAYMAVLMLWPRAFTIVFELKAPPSLETRIALAMTAVLLLGWTALLVWGALDPIARRGVLLLTMVPVVPGLAAVMVYAWHSGYLDARPTITTLSSQAVLLLPFGVGYGRAGRL